MSEFQDTIGASVKALESLRGMESEFDRAVELLSRCVREGGKVLVCGNGGSAADAAHFATELLCRFEKERDSLPGIALTMDGSFLTATGNDYGFDRVFSRQIEGLGKAGDVLVGISTSGNSPNVLLAFEEAKRRGLRTLAMLGREGGKAAGVADVELIVKVGSTARIQEAQKVLIHALCAGMEGALFGDL
ncbi:MAG: SIS domain-containing protein [Verrucomicrobiota bacterium]